MAPRKTSILTELWKSLRRKLQHGQGTAATVGTTTGSALIGADADWAKARHRRGDGAAVGLGAVLLTRAEATDT